MLSVVQYRFIAPLFFLAGLVSSYDRPFSLCCLGVAKFSSNEEVWGTYCGYHPSNKSELVGGRCIDKTSHKCPGWSRATFCAGEWPGPGGQCSMGTDCVLPPDDAGRVTGFVGLSGRGASKDAETRAGRDIASIPFYPVYHQGDPGNGIGGYDLRSPADRAFSFDYDHSGKLDHLALYRPRTGTMWILKKSGGDFFPVYHQGDPGNGIGGYDLKSPNDQAFAFDYDHSGRLDFLALYRPGTGTIWILKNIGGEFSPVYHQGDPGSGIGGFNLLSTADRVFAFDYDHSGNLDHLVLYRPGTGTIWILQNSGGVFRPVYHEGDPGHGIGGYDLLSPDDRVFAFDYDHSGKLDHLVLYRPGKGTLWILKNSGGNFSPVYHEGDPGVGIGGYDLGSPADQVFAYDFEGTGKLDHLALYRPGTGTFWILKNTDGKFSPVYHEGDPGNGIGGYDLGSRSDHAFAFDYSSTGRLDALALYRPGTGTFWIVKKGW